MSAQQEEKNEYLTNAQGHLVPLDAIKTEHLLENDMVNEMHNDANNLHLVLEEFKKQSFKQTSDFLELLAQNYNTTKGSKKGNVSFTNYDGTKRVNISVQDYIAFGAELSIAKDLVDQCITKWLENGTNKEIGKLVSHAFRVDNGRINVRDVLRLKQIHINDETWQLAMSAIDDAIRVESSKTYIRFQVRKTPESTWETIALDLAKV